MNAETLKVLKTGLSTLTEELKSIDLRNKQDKYRFCGILEYCAVFMDVMENKEDPDVISCQPAYAEFMRELSRCCDTQIENLKSVETLVQSTRG